MTKAATNLHVCDDWISCRIAELQTIHELAQALLKAGSWSEVVPGLDSITVQFDPARISVEEAVANFGKQLSEGGNADILAPSPIEIPVCYDPEFAPDISDVADQTGHSVDGFIQWHQHMEFSVTMLGFLPGFAYLRCEQNAGEIRRLAQPRQRVAAGSVGMIGNQNCLYSFASPGGWPIIGRTPALLFDPLKTPPNVLSSDQIVRFRQIDRAKYDRIIAGRRT